MTAAGQQPWRQPGSRLCLVHPGDYDALLSYMAGRWPDAFPAMLAHAVEATGAARWPHTRGEGEHPDVLAEFPSHPPGSPEVCPVCHGSGARPAEPGRQTEPCPACTGS